MRFNIQVSKQKHTANAAILKAWENFTDSGTLNSKAIRKVIGQRWIKSKELGIPVTKDRAPTVITADEITQIERTESLVLASKNALSSLEQMLCDIEQRTKSDYCNSFHAVVFLQFRRWFYRLSEPMKK